MRTIEEKAKAYDEAIKYGQYLINERCKEGADGSFHRADLDKMFPELAESENEKIRKEMIFYFEQEIPQCSIEEHKGYMRKFIAWLEKQGEQKPADKVEPKFKVGDWIINSQGTLRHIINVDEGGYQTDGGWLTYDTYEKTFHLWTIQDSKDGDVLVNDFHLIFILKEIKNNTFVSHCSVIERGNDVITNSIAEREVGYSELVKFYPATQEQRSKLFSKMAEEGYEWDADKKELKKIEQKPAEWSEEDEKMLKDTIRFCELCGNKVSANWLKSLKDRVQPQPKQEWSEEDKKMIDLLIKIFEVNYPNAFYKVNPIGTTNMQGIHTSEIVKWLNSLRPQSQWRPSDEQMEALWNVYRGGKEQAELATLCNDLKKLREE